MKVADLIIWDKIGMQHRFGPEAVSRTLQDIQQNQKPFGGVTTVLGGDLKQILPVAPKGSRDQIIGASITQSILWPQLEILRLRINMHIINDPSSAEFA